MGLILGRFRRKKTTLEQLEKIDENIKSIEEFRLNTELAQRRIVGQFILVSAGIYIIVAIVFYFYFFPATFYDQIFYITPLLLVPFIIWGVKRLLTWYYRRKISRNESKLISLRTEKKKLLDHVMDTETYKIAKTILDKFAPEQIKKSPISYEVTPFKQPISVTARTNVSTPAPIRSRTSIGAVSLLSAPRTPATGLRGLPSSRIFSTPSNLESHSNGQQDSTLGVNRSVVMPLPREILPRDRSILDKMVEYLIGDGPGNRYALICKSCNGHNGMALATEFEYFAFRCCYCYTFNPARKMRPQGPKLEFEQSSPEKRRDSTSSSEKNSASDTESEEKDLNRSRKNSEVVETLPMEIDDVPVKTEEEKKSD